MLFAAPIRLLGAFRLETGTMYQLKGFRCANSPWLEPDGGIHINRHQTDNERSLITAVFCPDSVTTREGCSTVRGHIALVVVPGGHPQAPGAASDIVANESVSRI
jgi:hypothetical protein